MKEAYFTLSSVENKAQEMRHALLGDQPTHWVRFIPERSVLLVLDMQRYFLEPISHAFVPSAEAILPGLMELIHAYYENQRPVIFTQHINTPGDAGSMATWWRDLITTDNPHSEIIPDLDTSRGTLLQKSQYDAFYRTNLEQQLRQQNADQVVVAGVMTHLCCESTARSAFMHGFEVFFLVDGTATYHEGFHRASLMNLAHGFAVLSLIKELLAAIRGNG